MKKVIFPLLMFASMQISAQKLDKWLQLKPIGLENPALGSIPNVENKSFDSTLLLSNSSLNLNMLKPEAGSEWSNGQMQQDTLLTNASAATSLCYSATYFNTDQWISGTMKVTSFGPIEVYVDGKKQFTQNSFEQKKGSFRYNFTPGKHTIIIKNISTGSKQLAMTFDADKQFSSAKTEVSVSPLRGKNIYDVLNGNKISGVSVSPSGKYTLVGITNIEDGTPMSFSLIFETDSREVTYSFMQGASNITWMPKSDVVTFLRNQNGKYTLFAYNPATQNLTSIFQHDNLINNITWSPTEDYIIYSKGQDYEEKNWQLKKLETVQDRQPGWRTRHLLCKYDVNTGLHSQLTWGNLTTHLMDISTDGKQLLISTSTTDFSAFPFTDQSIYMVNANTYKVDTLFSKQTNYIGCKFSPDGKKLLIDGGASSFGKLGENIKKRQLANQYDKQLFIYDLASKHIDPITKHFNPSVEDAVWHKDGNIYFKAIDGEYQRFYVYNGQEIALVPTTGDMFLQMSIARQGDKMAYIANNMQYPACIYTLNLSNPTANKEWIDPAKEQYRNIVFGQVGDWDYKYSKSTTIDGRYYLPLDFDPAKKYPMIVYYYGGTTPVGRNFSGRWPFNMYAAMGYVVYVLQPSGAIGYGQEFSARHQNNWGKVTGDEIITCVKEFIKDHSFVDKSKVGCMGASYGGFTTQYLTTQTDIFACAISHAGISSISSYWGDGYWGYGYSTNAAGKSYPWNRKDIYVDQSPLFNADKVHCPLLLIHGTKDVNVPTAESQQMYTALKILGKEVDYVLVKDADHQVVDYQQRILWSNTIMAYFAKYLKGQPAWWNNIYPSKNLQ